MILGYPLCIAGGRSHLRVWSVDDLLNDMKGFLDALGLDRVRYVGESVGGILGVAFATLWPERFKSMTLCATPTAIRPPIQRMFAVGHENWETALGKLGPGGWVKALMEHGGGMAEPIRRTWTGLSANGRNPDTRIARSVSDGT
jgi:pimeloyl-ACP methyl ester carboxylesterase